MPAPTALIIAANIETAFKTNGLVKYVFDANGNPIATTDITPEQRKLIKAISEGISLTWNTWQSSQTVSGTAAVTTAPGAAVVTGILP